MEPGSPSKLRPDVKRGVGVSVEMRTVSSVSKAAYLVLAVALFGVAPTQVAVQDAGSLVGRAPAMADRIREHLIASPFGTIHAGLFTFPQPAGSGMPDLREFRLASLAPVGSDFTGSIATRAVQTTSDRTSGVMFPEVDRSLKGDRLVPRERPAPEKPAAPQQGATQDGGQTYSLASVTPVPTDLAPTLDGHAAIPEKSEPGVAEADPKSAGATSADQTADPDRPVITEGPAGDARGHGQHVLRLPRREAAELPVDGRIPGLAVQAGGVHQVEQVRAEGESGGHREYGQRRACHRAAGECNATSGNRIPAYRHLHPPCALSAMTRC